MEPTPPAEAPAVAEARRKDEALHELAGLREQAAGLQTEIDVLRARNAQRPDGVETMLSGAAAAVVDAFSYCLSRPPEEEKGL